MHGGNFLTLHGIGKEGFRAGWDLPTWEVGTASILSHRVRTAPGLLVLKGQMG